MNLKAGAKERELIYVADPMCSWCWGFAPVMNKLMQAHEREWDFTLIMGGLRPGTTEVMDNSLKEMLKHHWGEVHKRTGQPFDQKIMDRTDFIYDTEVPCRAVVTAQTMQPVTAFSFLHDVQEAFYANGKDTNEIDTYFPIAEANNLDKDEFRHLFESDDMRTKTTQHFMRAQAFKVTGFPSLLARVNKTYYTISRGYQDFDQLDEVVHHLATNNVKV